MNATTRKRRINKIENINESYIGKIFRYSYGYDMIINEYAICVRQTCKSLMLAECERLLNNDDGSGKGRSWTTGKIAQNAKKYRTQKRALYIDGVKQHEYFSRGKGNAWYLWDGKPNNYDTWD